MGHWLQTGYVLPKEALEVLCNQEHTNYQTQYAWCLPNFFPSPIYAQSPHVSFPHHQHPQAPHPHPPLSHSL